MKKIIFIIMALCCLMTCSIGCAAPIDYESSIARQKARLDYLFEEMCIGGINFYSTPDYVKEIYGEPTSIKESSRYIERNETSAIIVGDITSYVYNYNDQLKIYFWQKTGEDDYYVDGVVCTASNLTTPSGYKVGMHFSAVRKKYFTGSKGRMSKNIKPMKTKDGELFYQIMAHRSAIDFYVDENDIIRRLEIWREW